jgi:hypothetical protein
MMEIEQCREDKIFADDRLWSSGKIQPSDRGASYGRATRGPEQLVADPEFHARVEQLDITF